MAHEEVQRRKLRPRRNGSDDDSGILAFASSREDWIQKITEIGELSVPGKWWLGVDEEEKKKNYPCKIVDGHYNDMGQRFEFEIACIDDETDPDDEDTFTMLWPDVEKCVLAMKHVVRDIQYEMKINHKIHHKNHTYKQRAILFCCCCIFGKILECT